jgi:hypothetical protein
MTAPSQYKARQEWGHIALRKDPYYNTVKALAHERGITMAEMLERMVTTYTAILNHKIIG